MTPTHSQMAQQIAALMDRGAWTMPLPQPRRFWYQFLEIAAQNRLLYATSGALFKLPIAVPEFLRPSLQEVFQTGEEWLSQLTRTVRFVTEAFQDDNIPALVVRTAQNVAYVTFDVDLLVRPADFHKGIALLQKRGGVVSSHDQSLGGRRPWAQVNVRFDGLLNIDLHQDFTWQRRSYLDEEYVWHSPKAVEIHGVSVQTPRAEAALLIMLAHLACESFYMTLNDLFQLRPLLPALQDRSGMEAQIKRHGWTQAYRRVVCLWDQLSRTFLPGATRGASPGDLLGIPTRAAQRDAGCPAWLPWKDVAAVFMEQLLNRRRLDGLALAYAGYCRTRQLLQGARRIGAQRWPYYDNWFDLAKLQETLCES